MYVKVECDFIIMNISKVENLPSLSDKFFMKYTYIYFLKSILMQFGRFSVSGAKRDLSYYFVRPFDLTVGSLSVCSSWEHSTSEISGHVLFVKFLKEKNMDLLNFSILYSRILRPSNFASLRSFGPCYLSVFAFW